MLRIKGFSSALFTHRGDDRGWGRTPLKSIQQKVSDNTPTPASSGINLYSIGLSCDSLCRRYGRALDVEMAPGGFEDCGTPGATLAFPITRKTRMCEIPRIGLIPDVSMP